MRPFARLVAIPALVAVASALTGQADARIVHRQGIAGVSLFMTRADVRAVLGTPISATQSSGFFGRGTLYQYRRLRVFVVHGTGAVSGTTTRRRERTYRGAGVGSTRAELRAAHPRVRCRTEFGFSHCWLGGFRAGGRVTDFSIRDRKVTRVTVALVLD